MKFSEYWQYDGLGLAELVRKGDVTPMELLDVAFERLEAINPQLNAVIHSFKEAAQLRIRQKLPQGAFTGVPFILKDLLDDLTGQPTSFGTEQVRWWPEKNAEMVNRYLQAGLVPFAKSNLPEFGLMISTESQAFGPAHNPWKMGYSTGGSSGGSAAAVAARIVPMASANDGGGSIRFPAACCGVFGLKPSRGRNPSGPVEAEGWDGAIAGHPITLSVRDSAAMLDALCGPELGASFLVPKPKMPFLEQLQVPLKPLRIGYSLKPMIPTTVSSEARAALEQSIKLLKSLGHQVEEADPLIDADQMWQDFMVVISGHTAAKVEQIKQIWGAKVSASLEPGTLSAAMLGRSFSSADVAQAKEGWYKVRCAMAEYLNRYDMLLTPTLISEPAPHGVIPPSKFEALQMKPGHRFPVGKILMNSGLLLKMSERVLSRMAFTLMGNVTGLPSMSVPLYWAPSGLPLGTQITGRLNDEGRLLRLAKQLEGAQPWFERRPLI